MRCMLRMLAGVAIVLAIGTDRAQANGLLVVPLQVYQTVAVPTGESRWEWELQAGEDGRLYYVQVLKPVVVHQQVLVDAYAIVPDPLRPCYRPPPPPPPPGGVHPSPQAPSKSLPHPTSTPQSAPPSAPGAPAAPAPEPDHHEHGEGADEEKPGGCGTCFPNCFFLLPCTCCAHDVEVYPRGSEVANYYWQAIRDRIIAYRLIKGYTANDDGTYTFIPLD